jgi:uncharacterized repeat protein (TIGR02543 family)
VTSLHGTVSRNPDQATYHYGDEVTLTATADPGWTFDHWSGDATGSDNPVVITIQGDTSVTANYTQNEYTLSVTSLHGTVSRSPDQATYHYGDEVTLTATAGPGWSFSDWSGDATGSDNPVVITIQGDTSVTANYTELPPTCYALHLSHNGQGSTPVASPLKSAACAANGQYVAGEHISLSGAAPDLGWHTASWTGTANDLSTADSNSLTMPASTHYARVNYTQDEYTLDVGVDPEEGGSVEVDPNQTAYHYGDVVTLTATAETGWTFAGWSGNLGTDAAITITIEGDTVITATFAQDEYTLTVDVVGSGSVVKNPDRATYRYGDEVELTATANTGWSFAGWSGDLTGSDNPATITMDEDKTVAAHFTQDEYTLTVNVVGSGSVIPDPVGPYHYGDVVELTAEADPDWEFSGWSGDLSGNTNPGSITMDGNKTITATFIEEGSGTPVFQVFLPYIAADRTPTLGDGDGNPPVFRISRLGSVQYRPAFTVRSRATDDAGNVEAWPPELDIRTVVQSWTW